MTAFSLRSELVPKAISYASNTLEARLEKNLSNEQKTDHDRKIASINCFGVQRCLQFEDQMARS